MPRRSLRPDSAGWIPIDFEIILVHSRRSVPKGRWSRYAATVAIVLLAMACGSPIPPADEFASPALGTPFPGDVIPDASVLPLGTSGVLFVNKTPGPVRVAVAGSIAEIPASDAYLFILPPERHEFFIYEYDSEPKSHIEETTLGKIRYVYLQPLP